jgi:signal peptidase I
MDGGMSRWVTHRRAGLVLVVVVLLAWFLWLRPQVLGGQAGYIIVRGDSMRPTLSAGDLVVVRHEPVYRIGQVVTYRIPEGDHKGARVIHRIVGRTGQGGFAMQGDNKTEPDPWQPRTKDIVGHAWLQLPGVGRFFLWLRTPGVLAALAGGFAFSLALTWEPRGREAGDQPPPKGSPAVTARTSSPPRAG